MSLLPQDTLERSVPSGDGQAPVEGQKRGGLLGRVSRAHWAALALGLFAGLAVLVVLGDRTETTQVAVAADFIGSGSRVTEQLVVWEDVPAGSVLAESLVDEAMLAGGRWAERPIRAGEPLTREALVDSAPADGLRSMSVPVARERSAGGALVSGDRVDVIDVADGEDAAFVVADVEVLFVGEVSGSSEPSSAFHVTLAVDETEALRLAEALADGQLDVVRSTGAPAAEVGDDAAADGDESEGDVEG